MSASPAPLGYASGVPSLFRRKSTDLVADATATVTTEPSVRAASRPKGYTPSKKELGVADAEADDAQRRRGTEPAPANRREAYKQMRERQRERARRGRPPACAPATSATCWPATAARSAPWSATSSTPAAPSAPGSSAARSSC